MGLLTLAGKALAKRSTDVAKRATDIVPSAGRRTEKFMGMVEEVPRTQLEYTAKEAAKSGGGKAAIAAGVGAVGGAAYLASKGEDESPKRVASKSSTLEDTGAGAGRGRVNPSASRSSDEGSKGGSASTFGSAFKEARSEGLKTFTFEGKKYTTELASEKAASKPAAKETSAPAERGVREGRNENISEDTRARAMESVKDLEEKKYAKGGIVTNKGIGASMKPHNVFTSKGKK